MRTGFLAETRRVEVRDLPVPTIGPGEVLIRVAVAGICGSDLHAFEGRHPFRRAPMVLGHEVSGDVVAVGLDVAGVASGDRVTVEPLRTCGSCRYCREGTYNLCTARISAGTGGWLGTFAEYFSAPAAQVHLLPRGLDHEVGVLAEPLAVGTHAVRLARVGPGEKVLVVGTGPIGLLAGVASQARGAALVACTDVNPARLAHAARLGMRIHDASSERLEDELRALAPDGFDVVLLSVTSARAFDQALRLARRAGRVMVIPIFTGPIAFDVSVAQLNELEVKGSMIYTREDFAAALAILAARSRELGAVVTHSVRLEEIGAALRLLSDPRTSAMKIAVVPGPFPATQPNEERHS